MHINQKLTAGARRIAIVVLCLGLHSLGHSQNVENQIIASQFGQFKLFGVNDGFNFSPAACQLSAGNKNFPAFTQGVPVRIVDTGNQSLSETVTAGPVSIETCAVSLPVVNFHGSFYLTSGTAGLQEAINANGPGFGANTVILDNVWYQLGGDSSIISSVKGFTNLGLVDITQTPYVWYQWNGSQYVETATGGDVSSVFGRTGVVTAQTGDYTCPQVTNCGGIPNVYLTTTLSAGISSTATTIPMTSVETAGISLATSGEIVIGTEWISYNGISGNNLLNATRGIHQTTPAAYSSGASVFSVIADFTAPNSPITLGVYMVPNFAGAPLSVFGCGSPDQGAQIFMQFGCDDIGVQITDGGGINQLNGSASNKFEGQTGIGPGGGIAPITNSGFLFDSTRQNQSAVPQGFGEGIAGPVESVQPTTIGAPSIINFASPAGTTTWSYECTGTDIDGNTYPGTFASITNGPVTITSGEIIVSCPQSAGAATETIWRTAGGPNQGAMITTAAPNPAVVNDTGAAVTAGTPPSTNSSIPKVCVNGEASCMLTSAGIPSGACTNGWLDTNQSGTPVTLYQCVGGAWAPVGSSGTTTICSGTVALGTAAIASGTAATTVTATCTGLETTDTILLTFNGSPLGVVGFEPSASGMLTILSWPTAGLINVAAVNNTASSITPGAVVTLNYRVTR